MAGNRRMDTDPIIAHCLLCACALTWRTGILLQGQEDRAHFCHSCAARAAAELSRDVELASVRRML